MVSTDALETELGSSTYPGSTYSPESELRRGRTIVISTDKRKDIASEKQFEGGFFYPNDHVLITRQPQGQWAKIDPLAGQSIERIGRYTSITKIEWEGVVTSVEEDTFSARLLAIKNTGKSKVEYAEFDLSDIPAGDLNLVKPGGIFRWTIGMSTHRGTKEKFSRIVFRRMPAWTKRSFSKSVEEISNIVAAEDWE